MTQACPQAYVHVTNRRADGFVEFDFSFGDADLYIEMILPVDAFAAFCEEQEALHLSPEAAARCDADREKWREGGL